MPDHPHSAGGGYSQVMMAETYQMVSANGWLFYLIGAAYFACLLYFLKSPSIRQTFFIFLNRNDAIMQTARACRKTGYISAVLTRYTALITLNILIFNGLLNIIHYAPETNGMMSQLSSPVEILYAVCAFCITSVVILIASIFAICSGVIQLIEADTE